MLFLIELIESRRYSAALSNCLTGGTVGWGMHVLTFACWLWGCRGVWHVDHQLTWQPSPKGGPSQARVATQDGLWGVDECPGAFAILSATLPLHL